MVCFANEVADKCY